MKTRRFFLLLLCIATFAAASAFRYAGVLSDCTSVFMDKMNVLYIGLDNPATISAPGIDADKVSVTITGGSVVHTHGTHYVVRVSSGTEATITIGYKNGTTLTPLSNYKFRVKRVPDPYAYVNTVKGFGQMTKAELQNIHGVFAKMENFDFDLKFEVVSFDLTTLADGKYVTKKANGPGVTQEMTTILNNAKPGDRLFFENVTVKGPDGTLRKVPGTTIVVK